MDDIVNWVHRCLIVPAALQVQCQALAASLTPAGAGMWTTPMSTTGSGSPTHFISSGLVDKVLADLLDSPQALATGTGIPLTQAQVILAAADVSTDEPHVAMARLGLKLIQE